MRELQFSNNKFQAVLHPISSLRHVCAIMNLIKSPFQCIENQSETHRDTNIKLIPVTEIGLSLSIDHSPDLVKVTLQLYSCAVDCELLWNVLFTTAL